MITRRAEAIYSPLQNAHTLALYNVIPHCINFMGMTLNPLHYSGYCIYSCTFIHTLAGQFWNIPISVSPFNEAQKLYAITVQHPDSQPRSFIGDLGSSTWDGRKEYCLYVGNQQGGSLHKADAMGGPNDPLIEGKYYQYKVDGDFATKFVYAHFNETRCSQE